MRAATIPMVALAFALLATAAFGFHLKTVFSIPLPVGPSATEFFTAGAGNTYYTVGHGGELIAVDLSTKKILWQREFAGDAITGLTGIPGMDILLVSLNTVTMALNNKSDLLWVSGAVSITLSTAPNTWTVANNTLFIVDTDAGAFNAVNLLNGQTLLTLEISSGDVFPNEAILMADNSAGVSELVAYAIPSLTQKWSLAVKAFLAQNSDYLVVAFDQSNSGSSYTEALVLNPNTLSPISTITNVDGIVSDAFTEIINHNFLLAKIGSNDDWAYFDLRTGKMLWQISPNGGSGSGSSQGGGGGGGSGGGAAGVSNALATPNSLVLLSGLSLHFINISSGLKLASQMDVPVLSTGTITLDFQGKVAQVLNLQGYTSWDTRTGAYVGRNEMEPNAGSTTPGASYFWDNTYYVSTMGSAVVGQIVVQ